MSHEGQVCVVTGAAQGLGLGIAKAFIDAGAVVAMIDLNAEKVKAAAASLDPTGARVIAIGTDLTKSVAVNAMTQSVVERFGRIDVLVNNAGGSGDVGIRDIEDVTDELWDLIIDRNLKTAFLCCRATVPFMKAQGSAGSSTSHHVHTLGVRPGWGRVPCGLPTALRRAESTDSRTSSRRTCKLTALQSIS